MDTRFKDSSEKAKAEKHGAFKRLYEFPFADVPFNMSFFVGKDQVKSVAVLRTISSREGKKLNRKFRVVEHEDSYEVRYHANRSATYKMPDFGFGE